MPRSTTDRMSRAERQAQTRVRLLEVASEMFLADGYAATSLEKVAVEAGFSKGAVYSNFQGKEELCLAVLDEIHAEKVAHVVAVFTQEPTIEAKLRSFVDWSRRGLGDPRWTALLVEFAASARSNDWVATELVKRQREVTAEITGLIEQVASEAGFTQVDAARTATTLFALGMGLGAMSSLDPTTDVEIFASTMRLLIR